MRYCHYANDDAHTLRLILKYVCWATHTDRRECDSTPTGSISRMFVARETETPICERAFDDNMFVWSGDGHYGRMASGNGRVSKRYYLARSWSEFYSPGHKEEIVYINWNNTNIHLNSQMIVGCEHRFVFCFFL